MGHPVLESFFDIRNWSSPPSGQKIFEICEEALLEGVEHLQADLLVLLLEAVDLGLQSLVLLLLFAQLHAGAKFNTFVQGFCNAPWILWMEMSYTFSLELFIHSVARFWWWCFGRFPRLVGGYCSYLLPKQALPNFGTNRYKTLQQTGWISLYTSFR